MMFFFLFSLLCSIKGTGKTSLAIAFAAATANINAHRAGSVAPKILILCGKRAALPLFGMELHQLRIQQSILDFVYICSSSEQLSEELYAYQPYRKHQQEDKLTRDKRMKDAPIVLCPPKYVPSLTGLVFSLIFTLLVLIIHMHNNLKNQTIWYQIVCQQKTRFDSHIQSLSLEISLLSLTPPISFCVLLNIYSDTVYNTSMLSY